MGQTSSSTHVQESGAAAADVPKNTATPEAEQREAEQRELEGGVAAPQVATGATSSWSRLSCCSAESSTKPDRATDSVVLSGLPAVGADSGAEDEVAALSFGGLEARQREVSTQKPARPPLSSGCACGIGLPKGPAVRVDGVGPTSATVHWSRDGQDALKFHIDVIRAGDTGLSDGSEVAFFEAPGAERSFELPAETLARASGPYQVRVMAEVGTAARSSLTPPGLSAPFSTLPEAPGPVALPRLAAAAEECNISIRWEQPVDDGGARVAEYEVTVHYPPADVEAELLEGLLDSAPQEAPEVAEKRATKAFRTKECFFDLEGLLPGTGPYRFDIKAFNAAELEGPVASVETSTAVAAPSAPTHLRARLLPSHLRSSSKAGSMLPRRNVSSEVGTVTHMDDVDVVRLEFRAPTDTGGRPISTFLVYAVEDSLDESPGELLDKPCSAEPLATFWAAECGNSAPGGQCTCDVAIGPNLAYTFFVEAHNGMLPSGLGDPSSSVFVPARVPAHPRGPPEVFRVEGGFAAELRWVGPVRGGGLPLLSFKLGVLGPGGLGETGPESAGADVAREVTISTASALAAAKDSSACIQWQPPADLSEHEAAYAARVDGLHADARYCFVLAASNAMGTGRWSMPSNPMTTATSAPPAPVNAVATVCIDDKQRVVITVNWESGRLLTGSSDSAIQAFHVMLVPTLPLDRGAAGSCAAASSSSSSCAAVETVIRERISISGRTQGQRYSWVAPLKQPGGYSVEVSAENASGQRSPPVVLTMDVRPEVFPMRDESALQAPSWAQEPVLVLGPAVSSEDTRFGEFEEAGTWLQALLLWHEDDPSMIVKEANGVQRMSSGRLDSGIDVVAFYRRAGSNTAHAAVLAAGVTASRLQVALPSHVPMSLRLISRNEPMDLAVAVKPNSYRSAKVRSEPLLLMMSEHSEHLRPTWEVWARQSVGGVAPRWTELPEVQNNLLEVGWLEDGNGAKVNFEVPGSAGSAEACVLPPGQYEVIFGDERNVQHTVRRLGVGGWTARARRSVRDAGTGEEAPGPSVGSDDQCVICMERRRTHAFMHADTGDGHLAVCGECAGAYRAEAAAGGAARAVRTCPMCRRGFSAVQRIFS